MSNPEYTLPAQSPDEFMQRYGDAPVKSPFGQDNYITLGEYVGMEERFCPAPTEERQDPDARIRFLARAIVWSGQLHPTDMHYAYRIGDPVSR